MSESTPVGGDPTPAAPVAPAPDAAMIPREVYDREVQDRIRERNLYKPIQKVFADMDEGEREAIMDLAQAVKRGDREYIADWSLETAAQVTGKDVAQLIADRQAAKAAGSGIAPTPAAQPAAPALDPAEMERMIEERVNSTIGRQKLVEHISGVLTSAGYDPKSPTGRAIVGIARDGNLTIEQAITAFNTDILAPRQAAVAAAAAAAGQTPAPAPNGAPANSAPQNLSPGERMRMRFQGGAQNVG